MFDFHGHLVSKASTSLKTEIENAMAISKYALHKTVQLGNEQGLMHGTHLVETNIE